MYIDSTELDGSVVFTYYKAAPYFPESLVWELPAPKILLGKSEGALVKEQSNQ